MKLSRRKLVRFKSKKRKRDKSLIVLINFLYTLLALKILPRRVTDIFQCSLTETGHGMPAVNFNRFSVTDCILVICQKRLSMPHMIFWDNFKPGMSDFAIAALLRRTEGA